MIKFKISQKGIDFIKNYEKFIEKAYKRKNSDKFYIIGYGYCEADISECLIIKKEQEEILLTFIKWYGIVKFS